MISQPYNEALLYDISSARPFFTVFSVKKVRVETTVESSLILLVNQNACKACSASIHSVKMWAVLLEKCLTHVT
jgi:hypothetical protein